MLDIRLLRNDAERVRRGLEKRGMDGAGIDQALDLDARRREFLSEVESLKKTRNTTSREIGQRKKRGEDTEEVQADVRALGGKINALDDELRQTDADLQACLLRLPNIPHDTVPVGRDETANRLVRNTAPRIHSISSRERTSSWGKHSASWTWPAQRA